MEVRRPGGAPTTRNIGNRPAGARPEVTGLASLWFAINQAKEETYKGPKHMGPVLCGFSGCYVKEAPRSST